MILSRNSWHFKLASSIFTGTMIRAEMSGKISLCSYFWLVVFAGLLNLAAIVGLLIGLTCIFSIMVVAPITWLVAGLAGPQAAIAAAIWSGIVISAVWPYITRWWHTRKRSEPRTPKQPNILVEYIKAKKSKVCPIMEVR